MYGNSAARLMSAIFCAPKLSTQPCWCQMPTSKHRPQPDSSVKPDIHASAIVDPAARIGAGVSIGPYCVIGPHVTLDEGVRLIAHVVIDGQTRIGANTVIYPFASLGQRPQDLKYKGEPSTLEIGANN